jgi:hypothetical protein
MEELEHISVGGQNGKAVEVRTSILVDYVSWSRGLAATHKASSGCHLYEVVFCTAIRLGSKPEAVIRFGHSHSIMATI